MLKVSLKDLATPHLKQTYLDSLTANSTLYLISFHKDTKTAASFNEEFGIKIVRALTVTPTVGEICYKATTEYSYDISVCVDPI